MSEIVVSPDNENYCSIDNVLFNKSKSELIYYACNKKDEYYVIPDSVKTIIHHAFQECNNLVNVVVPNNVLSIESGAFIDCAKLSTIQFENDYIEIDNLILGFTEYGDGANVTVLGRANSTAESFTKKHSRITFKLIE